MRKIAMKKLLKQIETAQQLSDKAALQTQLATAYQTYATNLELIELEERGNS
jgi:hypothetical protein